MFKTVDTNGDGVVDKKELETLIASLNKHPIPPAILNEVYDNLD
jgi:Ca2+-binding EF-hand superfamily protein